MRPDEHKKKKNAAYKKKHGIGQTKGQGEAKDKKKVSQGKQVERPPQRDNEMRGATAQFKTKEADGLTISSDSEAEEARQPRKTFQRRQIVSNWQKYEVQPEEDEKPEARGESFEKLLSMAGDAVAHFRFKDEQEWDAVGSSAGGQENSDPFGQYLNIDTQQIGQAMACLPLYKVLGISPEIFPSEELETMEASAAKHRKAYISAHPALSSDGTAGTTQHTSQKDFKGDMPKPSPDDSVQKDCYKPPHTNNSQTEVASVARKGENSKLSASFQSEPKLSLQDEDLDSLLGSGSPEPLDAAERDDSDRVTVSARADQKLCLQDEDLDSLLDLECLDFPSGGDKSGTRSGSLSGDTTALTMPEDESSAPFKTTLTQVPSSLPNKHDNIEKPKKDGVDLEDWLDSILDD